MNQEEAELLREACIRLLDDHGVEGGVIYAERVLMQRRMRSLDLAAITNAADYGDDGCQPAWDAMLGRTPDSPREDTPLHKKATDGGPNPDYDPTLEDTPETNALKIPSEALLFLGQKGVPAKIVDAILTLVDHARSLERRLQSAEAELERLRSQRDSA